MNIEELKATWLSYDKKLKATQDMHEKIIERMIRERSWSRISKIKTQYKGLFIMCSVELLALIAVLLGNPFDFEQIWQYIPYVLILVGVLLAMIDLGKSYKKLNTTNLHVDVSFFLQNILSYYEKNKKYEQWFGIVFLSIGFLVPFSFLPNKITRQGWTAALWDILIMEATVLLLYVLAFKWGAFKNVHKEKLKSDLEEIQLLKSTLYELQDTEPESKI